MKIKDCTMTVNEHANEALVIKLIEQIKLTDANEAGNVLHYCLELLKTDDETIVFAYLCRALLFMEKK